MRTELICLNCPLGCEIAVEHDGKAIVSIGGNRCKRGAAYAEREVFNPERMVTTTVRAEGGSLELLPVKTSRPVPKAMTFKVVAAASKVTARAPLKLGDVVLADVAGTGADLVATRGLELPPLK